MKGRLTKISNGYNYIKELFGFSLYYGINTLYGTRMLILSYKSTRIIFYQSWAATDGTLRSFKLFNKSIIEP